MSTRGGYGFIFDHKHFLQWCGQDAYPGGLGNDISLFISETHTLNKWDQLKYNLSWLIHITHASLYSPPIENLRGIRDGGVKEIRPVGNPFLDSLYCEYGYIMNLDNDCLDLYRGFQEQPQKNNPFGALIQNKTYYPCRWIASIPLKEVNMTSMLLCFDLYDLVKDAYSYLKFKSPNMPKLDFINQKKIEKFQNIIKYYIK